MKLGHSERDTSARVQKLSACLKTRYVAIFKK